MPMLSVQVKSDEVRRNLTKFSAGLPRAVGEPLRVALEKARARMARSVPRPSYPINWDSERQRRAYFATGGFGGGIPSHRTGAYEHSWRVQENPSNDRARYGYSLFSNVAYAKYVSGNAYGYGQSSIHAGRWDNLAQIVDEQVRRLPQSHRDVVYIFAQRSGLNARR